MEAEQRLLLTRLPLTSLDMSEFQRRGTVNTDFCTKNKKQNKKNNTQRS